MATGEGGLRRGTGADATDRAVYLDQACAGDQGLRDDLDRLLMADEMAGLRSWPARAMLPDLSEGVRRAPGPGSDVAWAPTRSSHCSAPAAWARCIGRATRS